jgi:hypothetical protein
VPDGKLLPLVNGALPARTLDAIIRRAVMGK